MIQEAEEFADEDKKQKERIDAKNALDNYLHSMTSAVEQGLKDKLDDDEKEEIQTAVADGQSWLAENSDADAEDIKEKQKEIESVCAPIVGKHYGGSGAHHDDDDDDDDDGDHDEL
jgi:heat shock protein 5